MLVPDYTIIPTSVVAEADNECYIHEKHKNVALFKPSSKTFQYLDCTCNMIIDALIQRQMKVPRIKVKFFTFLVGQSNRTDLPHVRITNVYLLKPGVPEGFFLFFSFFCLLFFITFNKKNKKNEKKPKGVEKNQAKPRKKKMKMLITTPELV